MANETKRIKRQSNRKIFFFLVSRIKDLKYLFIK